ncbi:MAG: hypothetical protein VB112_05955 [Oscillospiraceae bacterium]|nr:hypothetical protein [Oscillospiraceae bacterium]
MAAAAADATVITVVGSLPEDGYVTAWPVNVTIDGMQIFAAYDITVRNADGSAFQPDETTGKTVSVNIDTPKLEDVDEVNVYHIEAQAGDDTDAAPAANSVEVNVNSAAEDSVTATVADMSVTATKIADSVAVDEAAVQFDADSFSIYVVTSSTSLGQNEDSPYQLQVGESVDLESNKTGFWNSWSVQQKINDTYSSASGNVTLNTFGASCTATVTSGASAGDLYRIQYGGWGSYDNFYIKVAVDPVSIADTISTDGWLNAVVKDANSTPIADLTGYTFIWSKGDAVITDPDGLQGLLPNDGRSVNVALTNGGLENYTLTVTDGSDTVGTASYTVPYDMQLRNGSFENPNNSSVTVNGQTGLMVQYPNDYSGLIWKTTGPGSESNLNHDIEIIQPRASNESGYALSEYGISTTDPNPTADGNQFAELNCEASGALYQDVLTAPGSNLYWSLYHRSRARGATNASSVIDKMSVVIMSAAQARDFTDQDNLEDLIAAVDSGQTTCTVDGSSHSISSAQVWHIDTDNATQWHYHSNSGNAYNVSSEQYLTRFFFVAGDTSTGNQTIGNFLDDVSFSQQLPYTIEYYVNGARQTYTDSGTVDPSSTLADATTATHYANLSNSYSLTGTQLGYGSSDSNYSDYGSTSWYVRDRKTTLRLYFQSSAVTIHKTFSGFTSDAIPDEGYTVTFTLNHNDIPVSTINIILEQDTFVAGTEYITSFSNVTNGNYTITESVSDASGYSLSEVQGGTAPDSLADITGTKTVGFTVGSLSASVYFTNTYIRETTPDTPYLTVSKTFSGITEAMLTSLMQTAAGNHSYYIQLTGSGEDPSAATLYLSDATPNGMTLTWKAEGLTAGDYTVSETGANALFEGYSLASCTGFESVITTAEPILTYQSIVDKTTNCNQTQFPVGSTINLVVVKLTGNSEKYFVWTRNSLSAGERQAVAGIINGTIGFSPNITDVNTDVAFFSGTDLIQNGFSFRGGTIQYDPTAGQLTMHAPSQWAQFACGTYSYSGTAVPEIAVTNIYQPGYSLPVTGGIGTVWFQVVGMAILAGGAAGLRMELSRGKKRAARCFFRRTKNNRQKF